MPVANIVDKRTNKYDVVCEVIAEPSSHDNNVKGSTQFEPDFEAFDYKEIANITVSEAIVEYTKYDFPVTLFLYDLDTNVGPNAKLRQIGSER